MESVDNAIRRSGLKYNVFADRLSIHRATLRQWRNNNSVPPSRVAEFAEIAGVAASDVPTESNVLPGAVDVYKSLDALPEEFRTEMGALVGRSDQITFLEFSGQYPIDELPFFKEQVTLAAGLNDLKVRLMLADPTGPALDRAVQEGIETDEFPDRVERGHEKWTELLGDQATQSIRYYRNFPTETIYQFGENGILVMGHLHQTSGYACPVLWHTNSSPAWDSYVDYLNRMWELSKEKASA